MKEAIDMITETLQQSCTEPMYRDTLRGVRALLIQDAAAREESDAELDALKERIDANAARGDAIFASLEGYRVRLETLTAQASAPLSDEQVEAAVDSWYASTFQTSPMDRMRAAIEAAIGKGEA
jgi:hypothetical protein